MAETAPCRRCDSEISVEVEECPACGYDPGRSMFVNLAALLCMPVVVVSALGLTGVLYLLATGGITPWTGAVGLVVFGVIAAASARVLYRWYTEGKRKPTDRFLNLPD